MRYVMAVAVAACFVALGGCAQQELRYAAPTEQLDPSGPSLAVEPIRDVRPGDKSIDAVFRDDLFAQIDAVIVGEMKGTGAFSTVQSAPTEAISDYVLTSELHKLAWSVPDYEKLVALRAIHSSTAYAPPGGSVIAGMFTGMIAGMAEVASSSETDVYGDASLFMRLEERETGVVLLAKSYTGHCEQVTTNIACDSEQTKAEVASGALKNAVSAFASEAASVLRQRRSEGG